MMDAVLLSCLGLMGASAAPASGETVQEATWFFFAPVSIAYLVACGGWLLLARRRFLSMPTDPFPRGNRKWVELVFAFLAAAGLFATGQVYRAGWLLPAASGGLNHLYWAINNVIIFSPIFVVLAIRRQSLETVFLSGKQLGRKLAAGALLAIVATVVFLGLRGEWSRLPQVFAGVVRAENATNIVPVFLEGVALAFLFVRLRWAFGVRAAVLVPSILFAAAHIPRQLDGGATGGTMAAFFVLNTLLPAAILYTVSISRDVVWIGIVHYVMDIAIEAF